MGTDVEVDGDFHSDRRTATTPADLRGLAEWLVEQQVEEVVMESTAVTAVPKATGKCDVSSIRPPMQP